MVFTTTPVLRPPIIPKPRPVPSFTSSMASTWAHSVFSCKKKILNSGTLKALKNPLLFSRSAPRKVCGENSRSRTLKTPYDHSSVCGNESLRPGTWTCNDSDASKEHTAYPNGVSTYDRSSPSKMTASPAIYSHPDSLMWDSHFSHHYQSQIQ